MAKSEKPRLAQFSKQFSHDQDRLRVERDRDRYKERLAHAEASLEKATERLDLLEKLANATIDPPKWTVQTPKGGGHRAIVNLFLSDLHLDEVVRPAEVEYYNAFDRKIAEQRLWRTRQKVSELTKRYMSGISYEGIVVALGGDMFSGNIHEELRESNEDTIYGSLLFWSEKLSSFLNSLVDEFGKVYCVGVVGNHGRSTMKPRAKFRARDNMDWLLYHLLARAVPNAEWTIPESVDAEFAVYNTRYRLTHGDQFSGGSGISGMLTPILLGQHRKAVSDIAVGKTFDCLIMGHWHQYWPTQHLIVNGTMRGRDEFSMTKNYRPERPYQALWLTTPEYGVSFPNPIHCADPKSEGWGDVCSWGKYATPAAGSSRSKAR